jgi:hypothetical protein
MKSKLWLFCGFPYPKANENCPNAFLKSIVLLGVYGYTSEGSGV